MDQNLRCFNIYYLNFSKVYEISMMMNNVILSSIQRENSAVRERYSSFSTSLSSGIGTSSKKFLADIKSVIGVEASEKNINSSKMIESLDVKTTKSILLRRIVEKCIVFTSFSNLNEGDLVKLDNIQLKILNEENLRQILMLRKDALKGLRVEGIDINNLVSSILQDYSYILYGSVNGNEDIIVKIPMEIENEFESKYNVDDLLIGHVSVIGVFKGDVTEDFISSNTFNYLSTIGSQQIETEKKVIPSSREPQTSFSLQQSSSEKKYRYMDVIAIIQDVSFKTITPKPPLPWYVKLWNFIRRIKADE